MAINSGRPAAILKVRNFWDSRISKSLIQGWDAALALPSCRPEGHLCDFSRHAKGARRQYRDRRFRSCGVLDVFHAERVLSGLSVRAGERPGPLQRSDVVRHWQNSLRQLHSRQAGRGRPCASATLFRTHGDAAGRARHAAGLRSAGRQNPDRLGWDAVFLLAKARLSELSDPRALQRQKRELSLPAVGHRRGARPLQGRSLDARVRRHARTAPKNRTANAMPSNAGSTVTTLGSRRCARSISATICSPVIPSARW